MVEARQSLDGRRILVVDDEDVIRDLFRTVLSYEIPSCRVDVAVNGAEAVAAFRDGLHGVLLMDLHMPVMDGEKAFLEIRKHCEAENIDMPAVVFCTGYDASSSLREEVAKDDRHCILIKPVREEELVGALNKRLAPVIE